MRTLQLPMGLISDHVAATLQAGHSAWLAARRLAARALAAGAWPDEALNRVLAQGLGDVALARQAVYSAHRMAVPASPALASARRRFAGDLPAWLEEESAFWSGYSSRDGVWPGPDQPEPTVLIYAFDGALWADLRLWVAGVGLTGLQRLPLNLVGSSRVDLQACKLEYSIVSPK